MENSQDKIEETNYPSMDPTSMQEEDKVPASITTESQPTNDRFAERFEEIRAHLEERKATTKQGHEEAKQGYEERLNNYRKVKGIEATPEIEMLFKQQIAGKELALAILEDKLRFLRPSSKEDTEYRLRIYDEFPNMIKSAVHNDLPLRFHGTHIYSAEDAIHSGEISSSVDRLGTETSFNVSGQVSVTTPQTIGTTIRDHTDLNSESYTMPPGCIFVLLPSSEIEEQAGESMLMGNINFKKEPERLFRILTAPENIPTVKGWMKTEGQDPEKVTEFFTFVDEMRDLNHEITTKKIDIKTFTPYKQI
jgi:hypothetical protein